MSVEISQEDRACYAVVLSNSVFRHQVGGQEFDGVGVRAIVVDVVDSYCPEVPFDFDCYDVGCVHG